MTYAEETSVNFHRLTAKAGVLSEMVQGERRNPPIGSNHQLALEMTRVLAAIGGVTAVVLSIAGLFIFDSVSSISVAFAIFVAVCLLLWWWHWQRIPTRFNRRFILLALLIIEGRFVAGWLLSPPTDVPPAVLTGLVYIPLVLFIVALFEGRRRGIFIGMMSAAIMGASVVIGSQRPEMQSIHFNDWRLGIVISLCLGAYTFYLAKFSDQQRALEDSALQLTLLEREANTDKLTRLLNRRGLDVIVTNWTVAGQQFGILLLDIDHFKQVNDTYGHDVGDKALRIISDTLRATARDDDVLVRWGGEELMVITRSAEKTALTGFAERLRRAVSEINDPNIPPITVSIGVSRSAVGEDFEDIIVVRADKALYAAKESGRNAVKTRWP